MTDPIDDEALLSRFRDWLRDARAAESREYLCALPGVGRELRRALQIARGGGVRASAAGVKAPSGIVASIIGMTDLSSVDPRPDWHAASLEGLGFADTSRQWRNRHLSREIGQAPRRLSELVASPVRARHRGLDGGGRSDVGSRAATVRSRA